MASSEGKEEKPTNVMNAVVCSGYGKADVMSYTKEATIPETTKEQPILVKVIAHSVNPVDAKTRTGMFDMFAKCIPPYMVGMDFAGVIEKLDETYAKTEFKVGDKVVGLKAVGGVMAEYITVDPTDMMHIIEGLSMEDAACLPVAGLTAYQPLVKMSKIHSGQRVLIVGASGGVGHLAVQIAKHFSGTIVTGVCSTKNVEFVTSLGADHVIDYKKTKLADVDEQYDIILDCVGHQSFHDSIGKIDRADFAEVMKLVVSGAVKINIAHKFSLEEGPKAHEQVDSGRTVGKVLVLMNEEI